MFVYAPAGGGLANWKATDGSGYDGAMVHDTLTVGTKTVTLAPGEPYECTIHVQLAPGVRTPLTLN